VAEASASFRTQFGACLRPSLTGMSCLMVDLSHLAIPGAVIAVRVTPNARHAGVTLVDGQIRIAVTVIAEEGRATEAARDALAAAMGVAKTRLILQRGAKSRDKQFRLDPAGSA
jgi:uncharacterized protein